MRKYDFYEHRKYPVLILFFIGFLFIIIKLFSIQIINTNYKLLAENNVIRNIIQYPERGWIYDRNNFLLVSNQRAHDIMVVPYQIKKNLDTLLLLRISIKSNGNRHLYLANVIYACYQILNRVPKILVQI